MAEVKQRAFEEIFAYLPFESDIKFIISKIDLSDIESSDTKQVIKLLTELPQSPG